MTDEQKAALKDLEKIMCIDPAKTPYTIRSAGKNLSVYYTEPVKCHIVIWPTGALYFEEDYDD